MSALPTTPSYSLISFSMPSRSALVMLAINRFGISGGALSASWLTTEACKI